MAPLIDDSETSGSHISHKSHLTYQALPRYEKNRPSRLETLRGRIKMSEAMQDQTYRRCGVCQEIDAVFDAIHKKERKARSHIEDAFKD